jgi:hypothetical protein
MTQLVDLRIVNAPGITGTLPASWGAFLQLERLELAGLSLTGPLPVLAGMPSLTSVVLRDMPGLLLPRAGVSALLAAGSGLQELVLHNVGGWQGVVLDGGLAVALPNILHLELVQLGLAGELPSTWEQGFRPKQLRELALAGNALNGSLPVWLVPLVGVSLDVSANSFTGAASVHASGCGADCVEPSAVITVLPAPLTLHTTGTLSPAWGADNATVGIRTLNVSSNQLTGEIPDSWASLVASAAAVDLSSNKLWGSLGSSWFNTTRAAWAAWPLTSVRTG